MGKRGQPNKSYTSWRKSSYSDNAGNGDCVEVAYAPGAVALRDSKNATGPTLAFSTAGWRAFLTELD